MITKPARIAEISVDLGEISPRRDESFSYEHLSRLTGMDFLYTHAQFNRILKQNKSSVKLFDHVM